MTGSRPGARTPFYRILYVQVLLGAGAGAATGAFFPAVGAAMGPLAELFVRLLHLIVAPVMFCTLVLGVAGMGDARSVGRIGGRAMLYFEAASTLALGLGLLAGLLVRPGAGLDVAVSSLDPRAVAPFLQQAEASSLSGFLLDIIPGSFLGAFAGGGLLQVLLVAVLTGFALARLGPDGARMCAALRRVQDMVFAVVSMVMRVAPLGAFGAMAVVVGRYGLGVLENFALLILTLYATELVFVLGVLGAVGLACGFSILKLLRMLREELILVLGTSCSESALPGLMAKLERAGVDARVVGLVVPTGYSFNLDGTNLYMTLALLFIAQATNTPLSPADLMMIFAVTMVTTRGLPGVPGACFIALAATLAIVPQIPIGGIALLLAVDRILNEGRALVNIVGNAVGAIVIARWDGALDPARFAATIAMRGSPGAVAPAISAGEAP
ncbi:C4-dicarboxylate transporter DctA [Roseixanthobacter liquoris]|uniref:C4-dicarboxylate transporter DctA n=1 Tax=Roseixanthobacter liquoris TaxID=3119921 RepID=UPI003729217C